MTVIKYKWKLSEQVFQKNKGKVFSCFACGGGSTMGYKLAGFDVLGCNETDLRYAAERISGKQDFFAYKLTYMDSVPLTIVANDNVIVYGENRFRNFDELCECGSFPKDYDFAGNKPEYLIGMSVPPVMIAKIAQRIFEQWLSKL